MLRGQRAMRNAVPLGGGLCRQWLLPVARRKLGDPTWHGPLHHRRRGDVGNCDLPPGLGPLSSVSCADSTVCVASFFGDDGSSSEVLTSTDGGQSWSETDASGLPVAFVTGVSCAPVSECWAAGLDRASGGRVGTGSIAIKLGPGAEGIVASTADGGQTWQSQQLPQGVLAVFDIACPSDTSCYALAVQSASPGSLASFVLLAYGS